MGYINVSGNVTGRASWAFPVPPPEVLAAAKEKLAFHEARLAHWQEQLRERDEKLRSEGIEVSDPADAVLMMASAAVGNQYAGGSNRVPGRKNLRIKPEYQDAVNEAQYKIQEHYDKVDEFKRWVRILERRPGDEPLLPSFEDFEHFNL